MQKFDGFPPGKAQLTQIPSLFFSELLPLIDDLAELKVTLFAFYALQQKEGDIRVLRSADFTGNSVLMNGLHVAEPSVEPDKLLDSGLKRACERGTLLCTQVKLRTGEETLYLANTAQGRAALARIEAGDWRPTDDVLVLELLPERPNIYRLYEENIGPLTPMIAENLKDAERSYPLDWIEDAMRLAVEQNARNWRYMSAVLERWLAEGRNHGLTRRPAASNERRYITRDFSDFIEE